VRMCLIFCLKNHQKSGTCKLIGVSNRYELSDRACTSEPLL
jgi:hypothetical protein